MVFFKKLSKVHVGKRLVILLFLSCLYLLYLQVENPSALAVGIAFAQSDLEYNKLDAEVLKISDQIRCPTCQGLSIKESSSLIAESMKKEIKRLLLEGKTEQQIFDFFEERYGQWILREPKKDVFNLVFLWAMPFIVLLLGAGALVYFLTNRAQNDR